MTDRDTGDSKPTGIGEVVQLAARRAQEAQLGRQDADGPDDIAIRAARQRRAENLWRANPSITSDDMIRLQYDQHLPWREYERLPEARRKFHVGDYPHMVHVMEWWKTATPIIFLSGTVGRSKTVAAAWAIARMGGAYLRAASMWRVFESYDDSEQTKYLDARVLLLDDLGREKDTTQGLRHLETIVDDRRSRGRRTIITTNQDGAQIKKTYADGRLWSRLKQDYVFRSDSGRDLRGGGLR